MKYFKTFLFFLMCISILTILSCKEKNTYTPQTDIIQNTVDWKAAQKIYLDAINDAITHIETLSNIDPKTPQAKEIFKNLRIAFKKAEPYASYLNPSVGHKANGPALPIYKEDNGKVLNPIGLQKIEESIYNGGTDPREYAAELKTTKGLLSVLKKNIEKRDLNAKRYFIATQQQLFRIMSFSISGFDTPVSHLGISESIISLENLLNTYKSSIQSITVSKNETLDNSFQDEITRAISFIKKNTDFESFDRYTFIQQHFTPITKKWVSIRKTSGLWDGAKNQPLNFNAPTFFENDTFNTSFFMPSTNQNITPEQIALGKKLFSDPIISNNGTMSCATCHIADKAYTDGLMVNLNNSGQNLKRNTPTLINTIFQQNFFWDGRSNTLIDQVSSVFLNKEEFNTGVHQFSKEILQNKEYESLFIEAYGKLSNRNTDIIKAISAYVATLNGFDSKFDKNMRDTERSFTKEEQLGMNLFMGKALCATCHFMPLTNGTVPPFLSETEREVIGVPETAENKILDNDLGYYATFEEKLHKGMFKTPTVRNAALTGPYMHNGVYKTLEEVMDFYNKGGGGGLGFDIDHQTLPFDNLNLSKEEISALVAFIKTLNDTNVDQY